VPLDVELHHGAKALGGDVLGGGEELAAGVVDEQVDPAVALQRLVDQTLHLIILADVASVGADASVGPQGGGLDQRLGTAAGDNHLGTQRGELQRGHAAEPRSSAGDDRDLAVENAVAEDLGRHERASPPDATGRSCRKAGEYLRQLASSPS
jgi:hypothetical protein